MRSFIGRHKKLTTVLAIVMALAVAGVAYSVWTSSVSNPPSDLQTGSAPATVTASAPLAFGAACVDSADPTNCEGHIRLAMASGTGHVLSWSGGGAFTAATGMTGACTQAMVLAGVSEAPSGTVTAQPQISATASDVDVPGLIVINNLNQACASQSIQLTGGGATFVVGP